MSENPDTHPEPTGESASAETPTPPPADPTTPVAEGGYAAPPPVEGGYAAPPPVEGGYAAPPPVEGGYAAPPPAAPYGAPPQNPYGTPQQTPYAQPAQNPYGAPQQMPYAQPAQNAYGGYQAAPPVGYGPPQAGSLGYVEQHFGPVASFGSRVLALLIDTAITLIGIIPFVIGIIVVVVSAPDTTVDIYGNTHSVASTGSGAGIALGVLLIIAGGLLGFAIGLWNRVFRMGRTGQSIGKRAMGLMLIDATTGQPIGAGKSFLRELVHWIANQVFYISYLWMLWDADKQTLGDKAVASTVIEVPKA